MHEVSRSSEKKTHFCHTHREGGGQFTKIISLLEIAWNVQICREISFFPTRTPWVGSQFTKNVFVGDYMKYPYLRRRKSLTPNSCRMEANSPKNIFSRGIAWNVQICLENKFIANPNTSHECPAFWMPPSLIAVALQQEGFWHDF